MRRRYVTIEIFFLGRFPMVVSGIGTLIGIIFVGICVVVLISVGIATIRSGRASLTRAHVANKEVVWHKQISFLFGLCNLAFAGLLLLILLLMVLVIQMIKIIVFVLLGLILVISIVLVVRCILVALQTTRDAVTPPQEQDKEL
jgi:hypothetical protein